MQTFNVTMLYTTTKYKDLAIEAKSEREAREIARRMFMDEDTSNWSECDDASLDIDIEVKI